MTQQAMGTQELPLFKRRTFTDTSDPNIKLDQNKQPCLDIRRIKIDPGRGRQQMGPEGVKGIQELSSSILEVGLINPIKVHPREDGNYTLVAGFRRFNAVLLTGEIYIPFTYDVMDEILAKQIELSENVFRSDLTQTEECIIRSQIMEKMRAKYGENIPGNIHVKGWGFKENAAVFNESTETNRQKVKMGDRFRANPELAVRLGSLPLSAQIKEMDKLDRKNDFAIKHAAGQVTIHAEVKNCSAADLCRTLESSSIDLLLTDPPFGNSTIEQNQGTNRTTVTYTSTLRPTDNMSKEAMEAMMTETVPEIARVLKPGAHFYIFFAWESYEFLTNLLKQSGFLLEPKPLIWFKSRSTTTPMGYNYPSSYEPILWGHFKERTRRLSGEKLLDVLVYDPVPVKERLHPFHKPSRLLLSLISNSTLPGETVLDPFSGAAEVIKAARSLNRNAFGSEIDQENWVAGQLNLSQKPLSSETKS